MHFQALSELYALLVSLALALLGGLLTGILLAKTVLSPPESPFEDHSFVEIPIEDEFADEEAFSSLSMPELVVHRSTEANREDRLHLPTPLPGLIEEQNVNEKEEEVIKRGR